MRLVRYGQAGAERPGLVDSIGLIRDLSDHIPDIAGLVLSRPVLLELARINVDALPVVEPEPRIGPCVGGVGKFIGIGLNYIDHAAESGARPPSEPIVFMKATSSICGPYDHLVLPRGSRKTDWEVELGVVIGKTAKYVREANALNHVAGYCVVNDVSEREFQIEREGQWAKGKSADTFGPIGPWLVTADEIGDPQHLNLWLRVNGQPMQEGTTAAMIFDVAYLVSYLSHFMTLHPGDIIATGTPAGVGMGRKPQRFLHSGDLIEAGIDGLGAQRQRVVADR